jgi:hypothetical protein
VSLGVGSLTPFPFTERRRTSYMRRPETAGAAMWTRRFLPAGTTQALFGPAILQSPATVVDLRGFAAARRSHGYCHQRADGAGGNEFKTHRELTETRCSSSSLGLAFPILL